MHKLSSHWTIQLKQNFKKHWQKQTLSLIHDDQFHWVFLIFYSVRANYHQSAELEVALDTKESSDPLTCKQLY